MLIDEGSAIYFRFSADSQESETITYLVASPGPCSSITPSISLREIIVFLGYRSLAANDIQLRNFSDPLTTIITTDYQELSDQIPPPPQDDNRRVQPKRTQTQAKSATPGQFQGFLLNMKITLEFVPTTPATTNTHHRTASRDSGFQESSIKYRRSLPPLATRATFIVRDVITPNVAVMTLCNSSHQYPIIAKIPHSAERRDAEITAYESLTQLQGGPIPHYYGLHRIVIDGQATDQDVLLMEFITPGTSIKSLADAEEWDRINSLRESAMSALGMIHHARVVHHDAYARNFLVSENEEVVVVDFDLSSQHADNLKRRLREQAADRSFLNEAFYVPGSMRDGN